MALTLFFTYRCAGSWSIYSSVFPSAGSVPGFSEGEKKPAVSKGSFKHSTSRTGFRLSIITVISWNGVVCVTPKRDLGSCDKL